MIREVIVVSHDDQQVRTWFDFEKADRWTDRDPFSGNGAGGPARGEGVVRTAGGKWLSERWTNWSGERNTYAEITPEEARAWLIAQRLWEAVESMFGELEEGDVGPGRPPVGGLVGVRIGDQLDAVDAYAEQRGISRAEAVRQLIATALSAPAE